MPKGLYVKKGSWLEKRIEEARKEIEKWPEWMRKSARFEGMPRS